VATFKLTLAYDGTDFVGWQRQARGRSVQALVEDALARIEGGSVTVIGAGRTDAGVHALGQVASVQLTRPMEAFELRRALNATLPPDVRALAVDLAPEGFNARYAAHSKSYRYRIVSDEVISPFDRRFAWHVPGPLDIVAMRRAASGLKGRHDFSAFQSTGGGATTPVREIAVSQLRASPVSETGLDITYEVIGQGFLRHMIRAIVGTLVQIGRGRVRADEVDTILRSRDRRRAGPTAPARGLVLVAVYYDRCERRGHTHVDRNEAIT
jgi:tRNA pseudouridine38-40 synthase